jgi:hypothetical protein
VLALSSFVHLRILPVTMGIKETLKLKDPKEEYASELVKAY